jgi:hypothetical protein
MLPVVDPQRHRAELLRQLDAIAQQVQARPGGPRDQEAVREIVAVLPSAGARLAPEQLDDTKADARLIGMVPDSGTVLLDVASGELGYLREKIDAYADDANVTPRLTRDGVRKLDDRGAPLLARAAEAAVAPIGRIRLADLDDLGGVGVRGDAMIDQAARWVEIGCRGGYRNPSEYTSASRAQMGRQLYRLGVRRSLDEFVGPDQIYFLARLSRLQLQALCSATDCIQEIELAPPPLRDLRIFDDLTTGDLAGFRLRSPPPDAPSVVLLDTGIATAHPLLRSAILTATTAGPEIPSPEDTYGHGTKMAGLALYRDLGRDIERGHGEATHWLQSARLLIAPHYGTAADDNYENWPELTARAMGGAEQADVVARNRAYVLAVTRSMQEPPLDGLAPTLWSQALDQLAYGSGRGRLIVVSAGNARDDQWLALAAQFPQLQLSEKIHQPAQAANVLTVGACTARTALPRDEDYAEARVVAKRPGSISPYTSTGFVRSGWPIKPDVVFEGGNLAISGTLVDAAVPTLSALTTGHRHAIGRPLGLLSMTSEASARVAHLAATIWRLEPDLRAESVRALIVHSASWTEAMKADFRSMNDRLQACGYGVPDERLASECAKGVATIVVEASMPNAVMEQVPRSVPPKRATTKPTTAKLRRKLLLYRLPVPTSLLSDADPDVELRVTLSYFAETKKFRRTTSNGLDLKWDMQGPQEGPAQFLARLNVLERALGPDNRRIKPPKTRSFDWDVGTERRSRGTVQSDRWRGKMSHLVGDKLIAVVPVLGWWDQRSALKTQRLDFSLVVSVFGPGVYAAIQPEVEIGATVVVEV